MPGDYDSDYNDSSSDDEIDNDDYFPPIDFPDESYDEEDDVDYEGHKRAYPPSGNSFDDPHVYPPSSNNFDNPHINLNNTNLSLLIKLRDLGDQISKALICSNYYGFQSLASDLVNLGLKIIKTQEKSQGDVGLKVFEELLDEILQSFQHANFKVVSECLYALKSEMENRLPSLTVNYHINFNSTLDGYDDLDLIGCDAASMHAY